MHDAGRASDSMTASSLNLTNWLRLDNMYLTLPAVVQLLVFIYSATQQNCHEYSSLFIIVIMSVIWFLCFRFDALTELEAFMRTEFLCISVLRVASGHRVKLAGHKSALNTPVVSS